MAKKYEVVELDGIFGLVMDENAAVQQEGLNKYPIQCNETTGQISRMKQNGRSMYDNYFVTKGNITFDDNGLYEPRGVTHYMGHRMSLDQLSAETGSTFVRLSERFSSKHTEDVSNYQETSKSRLGQLFQTIISGAKKLEEVTDRIQQQNIEDLNVQIPGFKVGYEQAAYKAKVFADNLEDKFIDHFIETDKGQQTPPPAKKESLNSVIKEASARAASQSAVISPTKESTHTKTPSISVGNMGR